MVVEHRWVITLCLKSWMQETGLDLKTQCPPYARMNEVLVASHSIKSLNAMAINSHYYVSFNPEVMHDASLYLNIATPATIWRSLHTGWSLTGHARPECLYAAVHFKHWQLGKGTYELYVDIFWLYWTHLQAVGAFLYTKFAFHVLACMHGFHTHDAYLFVHFAYHVCQRWYA